MIQTEYYMTRDDGVNLYRTYSDANLMIRQEQTGNVYTEAVDVENSGYTYTETDTPIDESEEDDENEQLVEAAKILLGVSE